MKKIIIFISLCNMLFASFPGTNQIYSPIWAEGRITNISGYGKFGELFTYIQGNHYFSYLALFAAIAVIVAFILHYSIIGPKVFSHDGKKIYAFAFFTRFIHFLAAISWLILVPTGFILMFGTTFGGGEFVRSCKNLHGIATIIFSIAVLPMFFIWLKRMLPKMYDIKWMMIVGGYLSKVKKPVPAGKFNAGQKMWFWIATGGGIIMILTGASMYFLDYNIPTLREFLGISQIDILRVSAIIHNILGAVCAVFLLVHIYMSVFAIKGSIHAIITGYKEEEEVQILHSYWYKELQNKGLV